MPVERVNDVGIYYEENGSGFPLLVRSGARLARGLIDFMLDLHAGEHDYIEVHPPLLSNRESLTATGQLPKFEEDVYRTTPDDLFLIPTGGRPAAIRSSDDRGDGTPEAVVPWENFPRIVDFSRSLGNDQNDEGWIPVTLAGARCERSTGRMRRWRRYDHGERYGADGWFGRAARRAD